MTKEWQEQLQTILLKKLGPTKGKILAKKYKNAFPVNYIDDCTVEQAIYDIFKIEQLATKTPLAIDLHQAMSKTESPLRLRIFQFGKPLFLSDILPIIENMDLRTLNEHPYKIKLATNSIIWISDFNVTYTKNASLDIANLKPIFEEALMQVCFGLCENDGFNKLTLGAALTWREVNILRTYTKYLYQIRFRFSQAYIEKTFANNPALACHLINLFKLKFDPVKKSSAAKRLAPLEEKIQQMLETLTSLEEDLILRRFWQLITATLRTSYFQTATDTQPKEYLAIKLQSQLIPELPLPRPLYEIFVCSPRFEAIHLRAAKVARGGIRWSDRAEDFRTEILGLMKAQKVKNAIIVPSGAKGGFVLKALPPQATRETTQAEVIHCYKAFIHGLLDLTDNIKEGKIIRPPQVVCYDDTDPYLVVAADKGTATFSDIANRISKKHNFWLGDAFASGGSTGYDHKKIGITARGAWESIRSHFHQLNINMDTTDFTVVGIGDMSGDVFGNGMIYSSHIKLVAAFDHRHIFLDPHPHPKKSFQERLRLFRLPLSSWEDYNPKLISAGGGVYRRTSKSIALSAKVKKMLGIQENSLTPQELIRSILKTPVDLLYNGGIGTYVKAHTESHLDVGDKTNDFCRVNGNELQCRVVGEGGNLGFTQLGRIEYALHGGLIHTDFIDNSGGVNCSDHEVNIKIFLNEEVAKGRLTEKKRNELLAKTTPEVVKLVLNDNYHQALTLSLHTMSHIDLYQNYIRDLEASHTLDRQVEFLPDDKKILERKAAGQSLTCPEIAVLLAYTKIHIKNEVLKSNLPANPFFCRMIETAFPQTLHKLYGTTLQKHRLHREIIATQLSNFVVNQMGVTFVYRMQAETGATVADVIRAQTIAARIFESDKIKIVIRSLDFKIPVKLQYELLHYVRYLLNLSTHWFLRSQYLKDDITTTINHFSTRIKKLEKIVPHLMVGQTKAYLETLTGQFLKIDLSKEMAQYFATYRALYTALNITEIETQYGFDLIKTAKVYFDIGKQFNLVWFRDHINNDSREGHWKTLACLTLRDELDKVQKKLTIEVLQHNINESNLSKLIKQWMTKHRRAVERWKTVLQMLHDSNNIDYSMFFIVLRELADMIA